MNLLSIFTGTEKQQLPVLHDKSSYFWVHGGPTLANLDDLAKALGSMPYETFQYHVRDDKNDFATWVRDALGEDKLALRIGQFRTARNIKKAVTAHITRNYTL